MTKGVPVNEKLLGAGFAPHTPKLLLVVFSYRHKEFLKGRIGPWRSRKAPPGTQKVLLFAGALSPFSFSLRHKKFLEGCLSFLLLASQPHRKFLLPKGARLLIYLYFPRL